MDYVSVFYLTDGITKISISKTKEYYDDIYICTENYIFKINDGDWIYIPMLFSNYDSINNKISIIKKYINILFKEYEMINFSDIKKI